MKHSEENWKYILSDEQEMTPSTYQADKERIWNKIAAQTKPSKKIVFTPWITHAAAAAVGMLLVLSFFLFQNKPQQTIAVQKPINTTPPVIKNNEPHIVDVPTIVKPPVKKSLEKKAIIKQPPIIAKQETIIIDTQIVVKYVSVKQEEQSQPITTFPNKTETPKVIHLADIEKKPLANTNPNFVERLLASKLNTPQYIPTFKPSDIIQSLSK